MSNDDTHNSVTEKVNSKPSSKQTFKEYYESNPEFKKKHREYVKQRVPCVECGKMVPKGNLSAHRKTKKHSQNAATLSATLLNGSGISDQKNFSDVKTIDMTGIQNSIIIDIKMIKNDLKKLKQLINKKENV